MSATVQYNAPDYFLVDDLLTEEHKIVRDSIRDWVNREVKPVIEDLNQKHQIPFELSNH
jgi:glutaryl-CoA dehydrogenase